MSNKGFPVGQADAADDASLFSSLMTEDEAPQTEQVAQPGQDEGQEDGQDEGEGTEGEQQDRKARVARDEGGRFAKPDGKQPQDQPVKGEDRHAAGIRRELTEERQRRQAVEAERESERQERARLQGRLEALERQMTQAARPAPQPQQAEAVPDRWTDPEGYDRYRERQLEARFNARLEQQQTQRVSLSFSEAAAQHGEAFQAAFRAADGLDPRDPATATLLQRVKFAPDPAAVLMTWHKQEQARREIGADPLAFRERTRAELLNDPSKLMEDPAFRDRMLDHLRQQAQQGGQNGGPRTLTNLPPSLNGARGGNTMRGGQEADDNTDRGLFKSVMGS